MTTRLFKRATRGIILGSAPLWLTLTGGNAQANPQGMTVVSGSAHPVQQGNTLQITTSQNAVLQWSSFDIAAGETTLFQQPSATSIVFNNIRNANPSTIFGSLRANGIVVLQNANGFYFGPNAFVQAGGLVVTTAAINPWASGGGVGWSFDGPPATSPIVNYGTLQTASGGSLFLIGKEIENNGKISAPGGTAALVAGQEVLLSERPNGLSLSAPVQLPAGSVDNHGKIVADAGQVLLQAQTVNNSGAIQANSVRQNNGVIELYASQDVQLAGTSVIEANGGANGISAGGSVTIKSGGTFSDTTGSQINIRGGANGGNGGSLEISAPNVLSLNSSMDATAQPGYTAGGLLLDPTTINLGTSGTGTVPGSGTVTSGSSPSTLNLDYLSSVFLNFSQITLQATGNITVSGGLNSSGEAAVWDLSASTGKKTGQLILEAGGNITLQAASGQVAAITDENNWSVTLDAGYNFTGKNAGTVTPGVGNVTFNNGPGTSGCSIQTAQGNITVLAGNNVTVGAGGIVTGIDAAAGKVITGPGGNINVQAVAGNVNCGTSKVGYDFTQTGYAVDPGLGGISTASGGNVTIQAGGNITAAMPGTVATDYGSGAFGANPGNVSLTAGGNVVGHYVLGNGTGTITAGNAGISGQNLALSLIKGGWLVNASASIFLQEVRNPNGAFNSQTGSSRFLFNYDPLDYVVLDATQGVTITGASVPRTGANKLEGLIFPPSLTINAGSGGITLDQSISLYPSPEGGLSMTTTGGGNLTCNNEASIVISDSQNTQWTGSKNFTTADPGNDVLHLNDPNPVLINISGSVSDLALYSPKSVEMYVTGNIIDSTVTAQNLRPSDTTIISAGGEILNHTPYVILTLPSGESPDFNALALVADQYLPGPNGVLVPNPNYNSTLQNAGDQFTYNPKTGGLEYEGQMSLTVENALLAMTTPFLDATTIETIYNQSQAESSTAGPGYNVAGPGTFRISAASINLGNGNGINSVGFENNPALVPYTARGANIDISTSGNLSMVASTIESSYGGEINVRSGGSIDVGSLLVPPASTQTTLGIISLWGGDINVIAAENINVDGSRIAAYDGGNIFVKSLYGNVNAGSGGSGGALIHKYFVNKQGQVDLINDVIPGSGILATSFPQLVYGEAAGHVGNITVDTPEGNIEASRGGIVQLALGPVVNNQATINLNAGSKNSDGTVAYVGNVDASGSGVVGGHVNISATGNINGLIVASLGANVTALQNISATVLSQGGATVSAGGTVSGTIVGVGSVSVSGASDVAAAFAGGGVSASGAQSGAAVASAPTGSSSASAAATTQQVNQSTQANSDVEANSNDTDNDLQKKKKKAQLMEYEGRVTVLLPE